MTWTSEELLKEWRVIYDTRLGILCEDRSPTPEQSKLARTEADLHIAKLKAQARLDTIG